MKVKEINDCVGCFLNGECKGMQCFGGAPIEPPCCRWDPEDDIENVYDDYYLSIRNQKIEFDKRIEEENKLKLKNELKKKRQRESRFHVYEETKKIKKLRKVINSYSKIISLANAFSITNEMMRIEDKRPEKTKHHLLDEIEEIKKQIKEIENIKKNKLKELRNKRGLTKED